MTEEQYSRATNLRAHIRHISGMLEAFNEMNCTRDGFANTKFYIGRTDTSVFVHTLNEDEAWAIIEALVKEKKRAIEELERL